MPRVTHLIRRNGVFWFKTDLPHDIAGQALPPSIPDALRPLESPRRVGRFKTAIWLSLQTSLASEAKYRVGLQIAKYAVLFQAARTFIVTGQCQLAVADLALIRGDIPSTEMVAAHFPPSPSPTPQSVHSNSPVLALSDAFKAWSSGGGARGTKRPTANTIIEARSALTRFIELYGDLSVAEIGKGQGRTFRDAIARVPKGLPAELKALPLPELLQRDLSAYPARSATTINKSLTLLGAVLGRAEQDGYFDGTGWRNPFDVSFDVDSADEDYYEPFSLDELRGLMTSPVFSREQRPHRGRGDTAKWGPLLALFQGARRTEVIQLLTSDIAKDDDTGVWTIRFDREGDKKIKTVSSIRRVPVHPHLIALGFLEFVEQRRSLIGHQASLWPGFEDRTKLTSRANRWSEWFNSYLALHVVDDPVKKFHSFRGTFKRFGRAAGVDEVVINHLVGHSNTSAGARYGRKRDADGVRDTGYPLPRLVEEIGRIRFDGVQFGEPQGHASRMA
jgi:integrase